MMKIFNDTIFDGSAVLFFDPDFIQVLDSHKEWLRTQPNSRMVEIPSHSLDNYKGDFFAFLTDIEVSPNYHRITMLLNGFMSPSDYMGQPMFVFIPDAGAIETIANVYRTGRGKLKLHIPPQ